MSEKKSYKLSAEQIAMIEKVASHGDRVEIVPTKDSLKVLRVKREEVRA